MKKRLIVCILLFCFVISASADTKTLTILNFSDTEGARFRYAAETFHQLHPSISIKTKEVDDVFSILSLLSETRDADIIYLYQKQLIENAKAGALLPLDTIPQLADALLKNEWLPFEGLLSYDGHLYGFPENAFSTLRSFNEARAQSLGFCLPEYPYTWTDILQAALDVDWSNKNAPCLIRTNLANPSFVMDYISWQYFNTGMVNFYTDEFEDAMISFQTLSLLGAVADSRSGPRSAILEQTGNALVKNPVIGACPSVSVNMNAFSIPAGTQNLDLAIDYLSILMSYEYQTKQYADIYYMLLADPYGYAISPVSDWVQPSEELRLFIAENWVPLVAEPAFTAYLIDTEIIARYLKNDSAMPLDTLLSLMQSKIDLMLNE